MNDLKQRYVSKYCEANQDYLLFDKHDDQFLLLSETVKALNEKDKRIAELERNLSMAIDLLYEDQIALYAKGVSDE